MKKIILTTALSICSLLAFDVGGAMKNVGTSALNGNTDTSSLTKTAGDSLADTGWCGMHTRPQTRGHLQPASLSPLCRK